MGELSVAVLPFENLSDDPDMGYFARGFVVDLTANLTRFTELRVLDGEHIAGSLEVDYLLEGSVRRRGGTLRVSARLARAEGRETVWAEHFDASMDDVFAIQDEITATVAGKLAVRIDDLRLDRARRVSQEELRAHDAWLRGHDCLRRGTLEDDEEARAWFQQAIQVDPGYARAWAGLSISRRCTGLHPHRGAHDRRGGTVRELEEGVMNFVKTFAASAPSRSLRG